MGITLDRLGKRERVLLLVMLLVFAGVAVDWLLVRPMARRLAVLDAGIRAEESRLAYQDRVLEAREAVRLRYDAARGLVGVAASQAAAIDDLKGEIDDLARRHNIVLQAMDHRESKPEGASQEFWVEIGKCEAAVGDMVGFLCALRDSPGLLRVDRLTLGSAGSTDRVKGSMLISKMMLLAEP
jgi:cell division protein FtsL